MHNLRRIDWDDPIGGFDWARRFDDAARELMVDAPGDILKLTEHDDYERAVATPDHFIPLVYIAALSAAANETAEVFIDGYAYGSLSMTCFTLGATGAEPIGDDGAGVTGSPAPP